MAVAVCAVAAAVVGWLQFDTDPALWVLQGRWLVTELIPGVIALLLAGLYMTSLGISLKTVQNTISGILLKLGAHDRAQAVAMARDAGLGTSQ